jgi:leucyl aminopeptidase
MKVQLTSVQALEVDCSLLAIPIFEEEAREASKGLLGEIDRRLGGHLATAARDEPFEGKPDQALALPTLGRMRAERILLLGLGKRESGASLARTGFEALRAAAGKAARAADKIPSARLAVVSTRLPGQAAAEVRSIVEGALLGAYRFDRYKSDKRKRPGLQALSVLLAPGIERSAEVKEALAIAREVAGATAWARNLVNEPPLACTPSRLAAEARDLARGAGLACEIRGPREIAALRMGMFLGVARGSAEEPRLVKVSWAPKGAAARRPPVVLVGKAITFDSGGLSLKPTDSMVDMKTDMAGSAAVLAAMKVVAWLRPPFPVHALLGACENMPGGRAYKPSDVLTAHNGKTVEVTNTDAEGRLVLGDVLSWGVETLRPAAIVDVATLTGACVVALGQTTAGAFGSDGPAIDGILAAARASGEDVWRLPMTESAKESLKSEVADFKNTGERWGGAISAAHFLSEFVGETPWAHVDIAGPSSSSKERGYIGKGGTGFGVRTLVEFIRGWQNRA